MRSKTLAMKRIHQGTAVTLALLCAAIFAGCERKSGDSASRRPAKYPLPEPPLVSPCEPGRYGGRLALTSAGSPQTFNPFTANDAASMDVIQLLFSGLVNMDWPTQEIRPALAESWLVEPDQKTWTFKLRHGVRWNDGRPLTADDVVFTWNDIIYNPEIKTVMGELFRAGGKNFAVSKVDDFTVRVLTPDVFAPFLEYFGGVAILPKHVLAPAVKENRLATAYNAYTNPDQVVGSGPFKLKKFNPGRSTVLERNPEYWVVDPQGRRLPYLDHVIYTVAPDPAAMLDRFVKSDSDVHERIRAEDHTRVERASTKGQFDLVNLGPGLEKDFLWFNQNPGTNAAGKPFVGPVKLKWFCNRKFRQAVSCAINRDRIAREVYGGRARPSHSFISAENPKWNNTNVSQYAYNARQAGALLAEIGMRDRNADGVLEDADGNRIEIVLDTNTGNAAREKTAMSIQANLKDIGILVIPRVSEFRALVERIGNTFDYECVLMGLGGGGVDPASSMNVLKSDDVLHQWFPRQQMPATDWEARVDWLMDAQMRTLDFGLRKKYFDEVQAILAEELPMIYTVSPFLYAAARSNLGNVRPCALTPYRVTWNLEELYFKKP